MVKKTFAWLGHTLAAVVVLYTILYGTKLELIGVSFILGLAYLGRTALAPHQASVYSAVLLLSAAYLLGAEKLLGVNMLLAAWLPAFLIVQLFGPDPLPLSRILRRSAAADDGATPADDNRFNFTQPLAAASRIVLALLIAYLLVSQPSIAGGALIVVIPLLLLALYEVRMVRQYRNSWHLFSLGMIVAAAWYFVLHFLVALNLHMLMALWILSALLFMAGGYLLSRKDQGYAHGLFSAAFMVAVIAVAVVVLGSFLQNRIPGLQPITDTAGLQVQPLPFDQVPAALAAKPPATGIAAPPADMAKNLGGVLVLLVAALTIALMRLKYERNEFVFMLVFLLGLAGYFFVLLVEDPLYRSLINYLVYGLIVLGVVLLYFLIKEFFNISWSLADYLSEHYTRILYAFIPVALMFIYFLFDYTMSATENSHFCGSCHLMKVQFEAWKKDRHSEKGVACFDCHYAPGLTNFVKGRTSGVVMVIKTFTGLSKSKFPATVSDKSCLKCHMDGTLKDRPKLESWITYKKNIKFNHTVMVHQKVAGFDLKCTSCHNHYQYNADKAHLYTSESICYACHLMKRKQETGTGVGNCYTCHYPESIQKDLDTLVTVGNGAVTQDKCLHCHWEAQKFDDAAYQHRIHGVDYQDFTKSGVSCLDCHERIYHGNLTNLLNPTGEAG